MSGSTDRWAYTVTAWLACAPAIVLAAADPPGDSRSNEKAGGESHTVRDSLVTGADKVGGALKHGAEKAGPAIDHGISTAKKAVEKSADAVGSALEHAGKKIGQELGTGSGDDKGAKPASK